MKEYSVNEVTGCWLWKGVRSAGYGITRRDGKVIGAHRLAYEREYGPIPKGMQIHHRCEHPLCVNPEHLKVVTRKENARGRAIPGRKLSDADVRAIRDSQEPRRVLAERYDIDPVYVSAVRSQRIWADLPDLPEEEAAA